MLRSYQTPVRPPSLHPKWTKTDMEFQFIHFLSMIITFEHSLVWKRLIRYNAFGFQTSFARFNNLTNLIMGRWEARAPAREVPFRSRNQLQLKLLMLQLKGCSASSGYQSAVDLIRDPVSGGRDPAKGVIKL